MCSCLDLNSLIEISIELLKHSHWRVSDMRGEVSLGTGQDSSCSINILLKIHRNVVVFDSFILIGASETRLVWLEEMESEWEVDLNLDWPIDTSNLQLPLMLWENAKQERKDKFLFRNKTSAKASKMIQDYMYYKEWVFSVYVDSLENCPW